MRAISQQTIRVLQVGVYEIQAGKRVFLLGSPRTIVFTPQELDRMLQGFGSLAFKPVIEITDEKTSSAAQRLVSEGHGKVALLNFASATNAGGGFVNGAKAQEEDLARASTLYLSLLQGRRYYEANRACGHQVYTDYMIWSPDVEFFRGDSGELLEAPFRVSVITSPAPHANALLSPWHPSLTEVTYEEVLRRRVGKILALAQAKGQRALVLGAWGCGVFRNDPTLVADAFACWLEADRFKGAFDHIVFAIWDPKSGENRSAFESRFLG